MHVHRYPPSVVADADRSVLQHLHIDLAGKARLRLVHGVVHDFVHQVVEALGAGAADVHAGALADRVEAVQDLGGGGRQRRRGYE